MFVIKVKPIQYRNIMINNTLSNANENKRYNFLPIGQRFFQNI